MNKKNIDFINCSKTPSEPIKINQTYTVTQVYEDGREIELNGLSSQQFLDILIGEKITIDLRKIIKELVENNLDEFKTIIEEIERGELK